MGKEHSLIRLDDEPCVPELVQRVGPTVGLSGTTMIVPYRPGKTALRTRALRDLSQHHAVQACTWLANRQPHESEIEIESRGVSTDNDWMWPCGERAWMRTRVRIR